MYTCNMTWIAIPGDTFIFVAVRSRFSMAGVRFFRSMLAGTFRRLLRGFPRAFTQSLQLELLLIKANLHLDIISYVCTWSTYDKINI